MKKAWLVYLIECRNGSIYTGATTHVERRYEQHAAGKGARFTRMNPPVRLLGFVAVESRSSALSVELSLKRMSPAQKREWIAANGVSDLQRGSCVPTPPLEKQRFD